MNAPANLADFTAALAKSMRAPVMPLVDGWHFITLTGCKSTVSADGGLDEVFTQDGAVTGDCLVRQGRVVKVTASDGIKFTGPTGSLSRPDHFDVTDMCDLDQIARRIRADIAERAELSIA